MVIVLVASVRVSVCNMVTFDNLDIRKYTINLEGKRIKFVYEGHLVKVKVLLPRNLIKTCMCVCVCVRVVTNY